MIKNLESSSLENYLMKEKNLRKSDGIEDSVRKIIREVKDNGDESLLSCINKYEEKELTSIEEVFKSSC